MNGEYVVHVTNNQADSQPIPVSEYIQSYIQDHNLNSSGFAYQTYIVWAVIIVVGLVLLKSSIVMVQQKTAKVIQRLGKFKKILPAGFNFKVPFIDSVAGELDLRIQEIAEEVGVKSKDNSFLAVPVKVQYEVVETSVEDAFYKLSNPQEQIRSYTINSIRGQASAMTMEEIFQNKDEFHTATQAHLNAQFAEYGYKIVNVLVDSPMPSKEVIGAFNRVIASQREKEAATNEAEATRIKTVAGAKAEAESLTLKAEAYVKQRQIMVEGMAGIIPEKEMPAYLVGIDWRDTVREAGQKGNLIVVPTGAETMGNILAAVKSN